MSFEKYIDFNQIIENIEECICSGSDETYFKMKFDKCDYVVDSEILKYDKKKLKSYAEMINDAKDKTFEKYKEKINNTNKNITIKVNTTYKSSDDAYIICAISFDAGDSCIVDILGLVDIDIDKYVFLGCSGSHPFLATNDFEFGNSDGSGPDIQRHFTKEHNDDTVLKYIARYFREFTQDNYH